MERSPRTGSNPPPTTLLPSGMNLQPAVAVFEDLYGNLWDLLQLNDDPTA